MKTRLTFLFLLLAPLALFTQNAKIDSLKRVIETTKVDTVKGRTLCRLCDELSKVGSNEEGLAAGKRGLEISVKTQDRKAMSVCHHSLGAVTLRQSNYIAALKHNTYSFNISKELGDSAGVAISLNNIGIIYQNQGNLASAIEYFHRSIKLREEIGDAAGIARCLGNIGLIFQGQGDHARALDNYLRSLKIFESIGNRADVATSLCNIGNVYQNQGNFASAIEYLQRSLKILEEIGDRAGQAVAIHNIGCVFHSKGDYHLALEYFQTSLKIREEIGEKVGLVASLSNIASTLVKINKPKIARINAGHALYLAKEIDALDWKQFSAQVLYQADSALGNWKRAFEAARLYHIYSDSMKNDEQSKELGRLESKVEYEKEKEVLKARQEAELERYNWVIGSSVGGVLLMLLLALTFLRSRDKEKRANRELRSLNEEIQQQKSEIEAQNTEILSINSELQASLEEISRQRHQLAEANEELADKNLRLKLAQEQLILEHEQREQAQRMAGIGEVSTIVAHEVNTPLGAIKAGAQNLIDRLTQGATAPQLKPLIERAAQAQPLSSREERAALRKLEPICESAGFAKPEDAARQLVNCGLHDLEDAETLSLLAREPQMLAQLANTGAFMAQAANIQRAAERAATIVSALKTYSTLAGGPSDENAGASVADTLGLVLKLYDYYLSQGIELKIDSMEGLPDVTLDAGALSQVWTKLLLNSIYGMNRKGKLEIQFIVTDRQLKVLWLDNGPSPTNEAMARAFEPGVALRETDPPIDLWLCCAFIEGEAGGRIMASIPADGGLVVELLLPKAD